jgi:hypothetical protein
VLSEKSASAGESEKNFCANCGTPFFPGDQYCATCGDAIRPTKAVSGERPKALVPDDYSRDIGFLVRPNEQIEEFYELARWPLNSRKSFAVLTDQGWVCLLDQFITRSIATFSIAEIKKMKMEGKDWPWLVLGICCLPFFMLGFPILIAIIAFLKGWESKLHFETEYFGPFTIHGNEFRVRALYAQLQRRAAALSRQ